MNGQIVSNPAKPLHIQQLRNSLDLFSALEQIKEIQQRLKRSSINSNSKRNEVPSESAHQLYRKRERSEIGTFSHAGFTHNKQFRRELAKTCEPTQYSEKLMYNFRRVYKERQWLKDVLLSDSSSEDEETDCHLKSYLDLHHFTNKLRADAKQNKTSYYQYYGAGLLSRLDMYCEKRSVQKKVLHTNIEHSATKRTKVGRYAKSRSNEIAARRQSVWNFIATMEVPKIQKVKVITRKENLILLKKMSEDCQTAAEKGILRPCVPRTRVPAASLAEKIQRDSRPAARELIVYCSLTGRQRHLYEYVKKRVCIDDVHVRKSIVSATWHELIKICDNPESCDQTFSRQGHEMQLDVSFPDKLQFLLNQGPHYKYENLGVSWLKFAGFSDIDSGNARMQISVQVCLTHQWMSDNTHKLGSCIMWIWPAMPLSLPCIVTSSVMQGFIVTFVPQLESNQIHLRHVQPPVLFANNYCEKVKPKQFNCVPNIAQSNEVPLRAFVDVLPQHELVQRTILATSVCGKLRALDVLLKRHVKERLFICSHSERLIKQLEICLRYWGYNCRRSSSQMHQSGTFVLLVNASTLRVSHRIFSANILIVYSSGWEDSRHLVQQLMGSSQHKCTVYRLICKGTVEHVLLHQMIRKRQGSKSCQEDTRNKAIGSSQQQQQHHGHSSSSVSKKSAIAKHEPAAEKGVRSSDAKWKLGGLAPRKRRNDNLKLDSVSRMKKFKEDRIKMIIAKRKSWKRTRRSKTQ